MASITELSLGNKRTVDERRGARFCRNESCTAKQTISSNMNDDNTEGMMPDLKQTIKWRQLSTGLKVEKSNTTKSRKLFRSTVNHNLQRIETTLSLLREDFCPPEASNNTDVSGTSRKPVLMNPQQSSFNDTRKSKTQMLTNHPTNDMRGTKAALRSKKGQSYSSRNIVKNQETINKNDSIFLIEVNSGTNCIVQKADGSCCIKKLYFLSKSTKVYSMYKYSDELLKVHDKSTNTGVAILREITSTLTPVNNQSYRSTHKELQVNFQKEENDSPVVIASSSAVKNTLRPTYTEGYPTTRNSVWPNGKKMLARYISSDGKDRALTTKPFKPKLHNQQTSCLSSKCRINMNSCLSTDCITAPITSQPIPNLHGVTRSKLQNNRTANNQGCDLQQWQSHAKRQALTSQNSCPGTCKNKESASVVSTVVGPLLCWKCFDMSGEDDILSTLDSESGSDGNDDPDEGGGDMGCDMEDFDPQEDIEDIEYSSGGGDASEKSSLCDDNSLYQDDIINQETSYGMFGFDEYDDDEMEIAQKATAGGYYDDGFFDLVIDEESREYLYETASFDQHNDDDIVPGIIDLDSQLIEGLTEADECLY